MGSQACRRLNTGPYVVLLLFFATFECAFGAKATSLRGVAPSRLAAYKDRSTFTCTSGRKEIAVSRVNDDVCDCADGSDEPGTSACANGMFHCRNEGFKPRDLPSTFVDDGVCDCCDGSDETHGCTDSCEELGQLARTAAESKLDNYVAGAKARDEYVKDASRRLQGWKERSIRLEETVGLLKPVVAQLHDELHEAQKRQREAEEAAKGGSQELDNASAEPSEELAPDPDVDEVAEFEEASRDVDDFDADAEAKRIASQWTSNPEAAGGTADGDETHEADTDESVEEAGGGTVADSDKPKTMLQKLVETVRSLGQAAWSSHKDTTKMVQEQLLQLTRASKQAVQNHTAKKHELRTAETELKTLSGNLARDYGPENVYAALQDVCVEMSKDQYKYRVCSFGKAAQVEGSSEISLGTFNRCEDGCSSMFFTQGLKCWQGPARSMQIKVQCGPKNELVSVEEPERCVYVAVMNSPAECTAGLLQGLREELSQYNVQSDADMKDEL